MVSAYGRKSTSRTSPSTGAGQCEISLPARTLFSRIVSQHHLSHSTIWAGEKPARLIPMPRPPAPANNSMACTRNLPNSGQPNLVPHLFHMSSLALADNRPIPFPSSHKPPQLARRRREGGSGSALDKRTPGPSSSAAINITPAASRTVRIAERFAAVIGGAAFVASARRIVFIANPDRSANSDTDRFMRPRPARI